MVWYNGGMDVASKVEIGSIRRFLVWGPSRKLPGARAAQILLRSFHILAMALVVGGLAQGGNYANLRLSILATVITGGLLLIVDLARGCMVLTQGSGLAAMLKLALLGAGNLAPAHRLPWYLLATLVASVGSHMSGEWRHFSFITWKVEKRAKE